jgi:hypothetical protein
MRTFLIHWLTGDKETVDGRNIADALRNAGYNSNVIKDIDWYDEMPDEDSPKHIGKSRDTDG